MSRIYDSWERLLGAVLRREQYRQVAAQLSRDSSFGSDDSSDSSISRFGSISSPPHLTSTPRWPSPDHIDSMDDGHSLHVRGIPFFLSVESRELTFSWGEDLKYPQYNISSDSSSHLNVAKIYSVKGLDIRGKMQTRMMTPQFIYRAYLVYKLGVRFKGQAKAMVRFVGKETDNDAERRAELVYLHQVDEREDADGRKDGWMEVLLGEFCVCDKDDRVVEARFLLEKSNWEIIGLVVQGIEFRPEARWIAVSEENEDTQREEIKDTEREENEDTEMNISLLQQFVPSSSSVIRSTIPVSPSKHKLLSRKAEVEGLSRNVDDNWPRSFQYERIDVEGISNSQLPKDESGLASLTRDEMFSRGYGCLSQAAYFFDGMKKLVEHNEREINDLQYKLLKFEMDSRFVVGAKDLELEELRKTVDALKGDIDKCEQRAKEDERNASEKMREVERKLEYAEARATAAIGIYKNSEELKIEKHKFASKAFAIGFELCKRQVLEIDPGFDIRRIDVKRNEAYSSSSSS